MFHCGGFPRDSVVKNLPASAGDAEDVGLIPGLGRSPRGGNGHPLQDSGLENAMHRGAWWARVEHDLTTEPPPPTFYRVNMPYQEVSFSFLISTTSPRSRV